MKAELWRRRLEATVPRAELLEANQRAEAAEAEAELWRRRLNDALLPAELDAASEVVGAARAETETLRRALAGEEPERKMQ